MPGNRTFKKSPRKSFKSIQTKVAFGEQNEEFEIKFWLFHIKLKNPTRKGIVVLTMVLIFALVFKRC